MFDHLLSSIARALDEAGSLGRVLALSRRLGLHPAIKEPAAFVIKTNVLPVSDPASGIRVDFIFSFTPYEAAAIHRAVVRPLEGQPVRYAAVEDVIIHKVFAGRARDLEDVRGILLRRHELDEACLQQWLPQFKEAGGRDLWREYLAIRKETDRGRPE